MSVCLTDGMWFLMWVKGKFGDWGATACGIKDTRVEKKKKKKSGVGALQEGCVRLHQEPSHLCVSLCAAEQRQTDRQTVE